MRKFALIVIAFLAAVTASTAQAQQGESFARSEVWIETAPGRLYHFDVEVADTFARRAQGLMHRESLAPDAGMLFLFEEVQPLSFWMKNTLIPLDMLFIAPDGRIINIHERTKPLDLGSYRSAEPAIAVLEINGGISAFLGIQAGDRVIHETFGNTDIVGERGQTGG